MKATTILLLPVFLIALSGTAPAQEPGGDPRSRMIFQPGAEEPLTLNPTPTPAPAKSTSPADAIRAFFLAMKSGQIDAAYDSLARGTVIAERVDNINELKARTRQALESYGPISGYETIATVSAGASLVRHTCISLNEDLPLRWRFYFYKGPGGWKLVDLRVDDGLVELFDEVTQQKKKDE